MKNKISRSQLVFAASLIALSIGCTMGQIGKRDDYSSSSYQSRSAGAEERKLDAGAAQRSTDAAKERKKREAQRKVDEEVRETLDRKD